MTKDPRPDPVTPAEPPTPTPQTAARWWTHSHLFFVITVFTRYHINIYKDREVHQGKVGEGIGSWNDDDKTLAIEEGRRQLDAQFAQLQYVTSRATALLPVGIAVSVFFLTALGDLDKIGQCAQTIARILLLSGSALATWGTLVLGALIGGRATFKQTDALLLTNEPVGLRNYLARDYAENVPTGVNTNAARLTHLGTGVTWIALGALLGTVGLAVSVW